MLGVPETRSSRRQLEEVLIRPLNSFLIKEFGFTPLIAGLESIRIDQRRIYVDALEFHNAVVEGFKLLSLGNRAAALEKLARAKSLYAGSYLPGIPGKIINNTRNELESLYRTAVMEIVPKTGRNPGLIETARPGADSQVSEPIYPAGKNKSVHHGR
jgi:hypothetical protein